MNLGYMMLADAYKRHMAEEGETEELKRKVKIFEFLMDLEEEDIETLFDSGAFNEIAKAYTKKALDNTGQTLENRNAIVKELKFLFENRSASEILKKE